MNLFVTHRQPLRAATALVVVITGYAIAPLAPQSASADVVLWNNDAGGGYYDPNNWVGGVPGIDDLALIYANSQPFTIDILGNPTNAVLEVAGDGHVTLNLPPIGATQRVYTLTGAGGGSSVEVDPRADNQHTYLTLSSGTISGTDGVVGSSYSSSAQSTFTIDGSGSKWMSSGDVFIGYASDGELIIKNGGVVSDATGFLSRGDFSTSSGTATIEGVGSQWNNTGSLIVAEWNGATLTVKSGGAVSSNDGFLGDSTGSHGKVTVQGAGSTWTNTGQLVVGNYGHGELKILDGGHVSNTFGVIGLNKGSEYPTGGSVLVSGEGALWTNASDLSVSSGQSANASLTINDGGEVDVTGLLTVFSTGSVLLDNGTLRIGSLDQNGTFTFTRGKLEFTTNQTIAAGNDIDHIIGPGAGGISVYKHLAIDGAATLLTPVSLNGGTFSVGDLVNPAYFLFYGGTLNVTQADMTIGIGGWWGDTIAYNALQHVNVAHNVTVDAGALLSLQGGSFTAGTLNNNGQVALGGTTSRLGGGGINNAGLITGNGIVDAPLNNVAGGEVRVSAVQSMRFLGATNTNDGLIDVIGGDIEFTGAVSNHAAGRIEARDAALRFTGGLTNAGEMVLSADSSDVFGQVNNTGAIVVTGGAGATFHDDVVQNGVLRISKVGDTTSVVVFLDGFSGSGGTTGGGDVFFEGDLRPGNSPAQVSFDGNVTLGNTADTIIELAGTSAGNHQFDQIIVGGLLSLAGTLDIALLNGFDPQLGDQFDILDWNSRVGTFGAVHLPTLGPGLAWDTSNLYTTGTLRVAVPEPTTFSLLTIMAGTLLLKRRGQQRS